MPDSTAPTIVLLGAGHAHLHVAKHARLLIERGANAILVDPGRFWYSGLATGMLAGLSTRQADQVDPAPLIQAAGGQFIQARVVQILPQHQRLVLDNGQTLDYHWLSLNVGSEIPVADLPGHEHAWAAKPIANLARLHDHLIQQFTRLRKPLHVVVVGGGATGCEIAACIAALADRSHGRIHLTVVASSLRLLPTHRPSAGQHIYRLLARRGIHLRFGCRVVAVEPDQLICLDHPAVRADLTVLARGLAPPAFLHQQPLSLDEDGILIRPTLQTFTDHRIFAVGDCASLSAHRLPKLGIVGVRQGPILLGNLLAALTGQPLKSYRPQRRFLSILNLGDRTALATWGPLHFAGRSMLHLKNTLDRRFLKRYQ